MKKTVMMIMMMVMVVLITTGFVSIGKQAGAAESSNVMVYNVDADNAFIAYGSTDGKYASVRNTDAAVEKDAYYLVAEADTGVTTSEKIVDITDNADYVRLEDGTAMIRTMVITESGAHRYVLSPSFLQFAEN